MFLPTDKDLHCHVIQGKEGIGHVYTTNLTYEQFCDFFAIADTEVEEYEKIQRDLTKSRLNGVFNYLTSRKNTVFPLVTCVVTHADFTPLNVDSLNGISQLGTLVLPATSERALIDGQGRRGGIEKALEVAAHLKHHTIDFKFFITNTNTLSDAKPLITQIFSDYHKKVVKPNASINLFFDSSAASSTFVVKAYNHFRDNELGFNNYISLEGNNKRVWTLAQFKTFLKQFTGLTDSEMDKELNNPEMIELWLDFLAEFFSVIGDIDTFKSLHTFDDMKQAKANSLLCCAIGIESLGILARIIMDQAISQGTEIQWEAVRGITQIDFSKDNEYWIGEVITEDGKMIKGSAKQMAILIACRLSIPLPMSLMKKSA